MAFFIQRPKGSFYWLFNTQKFVWVPEILQLIFTCFISNFSISLCSEEWSGVLPAAPQGSSPPPPHLCSSGSLFEGEQWKVMGHKLLIRAFLGLIVGFVSTPSVSVLPHSRGSNEALCDTMSPSGHRTIQWKVLGARKRTEANGEKQGRKDEVIRERHW